MKADERVGEITRKNYCDTPVTLVRNKAVREAQQQNVHVLLFIDSDNDPTLYNGQPWHRDFWDVAFNAIYEHYDRGPLVIGAPYCGPPPVENVYVFQYETNMDLGLESAIRLEQYTRSQASLMTGLGEVAALPTGMIMFDMRIFDLVRPSCRAKRDVLTDLRDGKISVDQADYELTEGWFYYEWKDGYAAEKASTEDVTATRDIGLIGAAKLGYNPLRCAWDSWIGHHKPWCCGKPVYYRTEQVAANFRAAVSTNVSVKDRMVEYESPMLYRLAGLDTRYPMEAKVTR